MNEFSLQLTLREFIHMPVSYSTSVTIKSPSSYSKDPRFKPDDGLSWSSSIPLLVIHWHNVNEQPSVCICFIFRACHHI